jgi:hypothetical protein
MQDPWTVKLKPVPRTIWADPDKNKLHSDPEKLKTTILTGMKKDDSVNKLFSSLPGPTKSVFPKDNKFLGNVKKTNELSKTGKKLTEDKNKNNKPDVLEKYFSMKKR